MVDVNISFSVALRYQLNIHVGLTHWSLKSI